MDYGAQIFNGIMRFGKCGWNRLAYGRPLILLLRSPSVLHLPKIATQAVVRAHRLRESFRQAQRFACRKLQNPSWLRPENYSGLLGFVASAAPIISNTDVGSCLAFGFGIAGDSILTRAGHKASGFSSAFLLCAASEVAIMCSSATADTPWLRTVLGIQVGVWLCSAARRPIEMLAESLRDPRRRVIAPQTSRRLQRLSDNIPRYTGYGSVTIQAIATGLSMSHLSAEMALSCMADVLWLIPLCFTPPSSPVPPSGPIQLSGTGGPLTGSRVPATAHP